MELLDLWAKSVRSWYNPFLGRKHACTAQAAPVRDLVCGREERQHRRYTARGGRVRAR